MYVKGTVASISAILVSGNALPYVLAPTKADIQLELEERETSSDVSSGSVAWLLSGLKLEEQQ